MTLRLKNAQFQTPERAEQGVGCNQQISPGTNSIALRVDQVGFPFKNVQQGPSARLPFFASKLQKLRCDIGLIG